MQQYEILINRSISSFEQVQPSNMNFQNNYWVYSQKIGEGLVNEFNIKAYLSNKKNQAIIDQFIDYLKSNTTNEGFVSIFYNNKKISELFNYFFSNKIQNGEIIGTAKIDQHISNTIIITISDNTWNWDGQTDSFNPNGITKSLYEATRNEYFYQKKTEKTEDDSYYIPVKIDFNFNNIDRNKFELCNDFIHPEIFNLNGFLENVDLQEISQSLTTDNFIQTLSEASN